jgi:predicted short-subunit dehydrogenase-like oxidoreductase (DUF2520 family)
MDISIVGAGRAGTALAVLWRLAGHRIAAVSGRDATVERAARHLPGVPVLDAPETARDAELVVVGVPDDLIAPTVRALTDAGAFGDGRWVAHLSGATPLSALDAARELGGRRLGLHPLQTFPDVEAALDRLPGSAVAVGADDEEGFFVAERLAEDLGGRPFRLADEHRAIYHAAAVFASNYLVATTWVAEELLAIAGVADPTAALAPLQQATLANVAATGPSEALTGPAVRGDAGTIEQHLMALAAAVPWAVGPYAEMARAALDMSVRAGRLSEAGRARVDEVLARWT